MIFESVQVEKGLQEWAAVVAAASPRPPRNNGAQITGWCSWYNLYSYISEELILEYLKHTKAVADCEHLSLRVFQVDEGFTPEMGDWLEFKPKFPRGMKPSWMMFVQQALSRASGLVRLWWATAAGYTGTTQIGSYRTARLAQAQ